MAAQEAATRIQNLKQEVEPETGTQNKRQEALSPLLVIVP